MENKVVEAALIDQEIDRLKKEIAGIIDTIQKLPTEEYDFLHKAYVQHLSLKEVQSASGMSYSWVTTTHGRALNSLQRILDEREKVGA
jgi:DNA-directed RNA polymerase specialized sigma24 family protein